MLITGTSDKIQFKLGSTATTELPFTVDYNNYTSTTVSLVTNNGTSNDTTAVDLVPSPSNGQQNELRYCSIYNADSASETVIIQVYDGTNTRVVFRAVLASGDTLQYQLEKGWEVLDSLGNKKNLGVQLFSNNMKGCWIWRPNGVASTQTLASTTWYCAMLGRAESPYTSINVMYNITSPAASITYAEVAIYATSIRPQDGTGTTLGKRVGFTNIAGVVNSGGIKNTAISVSGVNTGDILTVVFANQSAAGFNMRSLAVTDTSPYYTQFSSTVTVSSARPSLVPTGPFVTGNIGSLLWILWQGT